MGHLNVRFYIAKCLDGLASFAAELGLPRAFAPTATTTVTLRQLFVRFLREAHVGAQLTSFGSVLRISESDAQLMMVMRHPTGEPAAAFQLTVEHTSVADRRPIAWPDAFQRRAATLMAEAPRYASPRTLNLEPFETTASGERAKALDLTRIALTALSPADCDAFGRLRFDAFLARIGDGMPRLAPKREVIPGMEHRMGGAAVEYRLVLFETPRIGDRIELRSAIVEVASHYRRTAHWLLDPDSGKPWGVATNVGVSFDLQTRKLATLTPEEVAANQVNVVSAMAL